MTHLVPAREAERLDALRRLALDEKVSEPHFDAVCRLACDLFEVPIATIAFLDEERQWFKACCGLDVKETPRDVAFCARTILFDAPLIIPDAAADPRFADNPLVAGAPGIRFYAGVPLALERGLRLGTLCLVDTVPRPFSSAQVRRLEGLGRIVVAYLRLHEATRARADIVAEARRLIEELSGSGELPVDGGTRFAHFEAHLHELDAALAL